MTTADEILKKDSGPAPKLVISDIARGTAAGGIVGMVGGALYSYLRDKKFWECVIVGTVIGGLVSRVSLIKG